MKTVLFYGNCQLAVIGNWLNEYYSDKFKVIDCRDCGLEGFVGFKNFAVWSHENSLKQSEYYKCIHEKIKQADLFLFQETIAAIPELKTEYIYSEIATNSLNICIANSRFLGYPTYGHSIFPYRDYLKSFFTDIDKLFNYFINENDQEFSRILLEQSNKSIDNNLDYESRNKKIYSNFIKMSDFIEKSWKDYLLFVTDSHPTKYYFFELIKRLFDFIGEELDETRLNNISYPGDNEIPNLKQIKFFDNLFPNIKIPLGAPLLEMRKDWFKN